MGLLSPREGRQRLTLVFLTLIFVADWANLLVKLVQHWEEIPGQSHYWAIMFAVLYPLPWLAVVLEKGTKLQIALIAYFAFFAAMTTLQFFVVLFVYPETKGITLEQLQRKLGIA